MAHQRRDFLKALSALGLSTLPFPAWPEGAPGPAATGDLCTTGSGGHPLFIPSDRGFLGRLAPGDESLTLRAVAAPGSAGEGTPPEFAQVYVAQYRGKDYVNPTLVLQPGQRLRVDFANDISEPTIVHWHGLCVDSKNDGNGMVVVDPGQRYAYDFEVCNRSSLYWYHPHPHGMSAGQAYRGLIGLIEIEDPDERALRVALDLAVGKTEIPLLLQDRRTRQYNPSHHDRMHGFVGDRVLINGTSCPHLDVATRIYRFRVLNASNARTYRLTFRTPQGKVFPFMLIGGDGGLFASPRRCEEAFIATAERLDILLDLSSAAVGDTVALETSEFDPMHMEMQMVGASSHHGHMGHTISHGSHGSHGMHGAGDSTTEQHGGLFSEGSARALLELRVRRRVSYRGTVPRPLSRIAPIDLAKAKERPVRLGFAKGRWRINDRVFTMGETAIEVKRDTIETWVVRNALNSMPHAMHLHGFQFQVLGRQNSPGQIVHLKTLENGRLATDDGWKDTVLVWPGETVNVAIDFRTTFAGPQTYMLHCHNLEHEDAGMMAIVKVV